MKHTLFAFMLGLGAALPVAAQDLALYIEHESTSLDADGVTRITRFAERLIRHDGQSWLARVIPPAALDNDKPHGADKTHKHADLSAAARWVVMGAGQALQVRMVEDRERLIVHVQPTEYANIGFDGKWASASSLIDPAQIKTMKSSAKTAPTGTRWYESNVNDMKVLVLWDDAAHYPRRIESSNTSGSRRNVMSVRREPMPGALPWSGLKGYTEKEFADLLD